MPGYMSDDSAVRRANLHLLCRINSWGPTHLRNAIGSTYSYWNDLLKSPKKAFGEKTARRVEEALGLPRGWLDIPHASSEVTGISLSVAEPNPPWQETHPALARPSSKAPALPQAHGMSLSERTIEPPVITWDSIMTADPPPEFQLRLTDAAMELDDPPSMRPGDHAFFRRSSSAQPGQVVLVVNAAGDLFIRKYQARTPGHWLAVARHPGYEPLDSVRDGLTILAVQYGGTWG